MTTPKPMPARPWEELTPDERANTVCDHLLHEWFTGNLRPVSTGTKRDGKTKTDKSKGGA